MAAGLDPGSDSDPKDPYSLLGVSPGAGFDDGPFACVADIYVEVCF